MVSASTRRLPSMSMRVADCAKATPAVQLGTTTPTTLSNTHMAATPIPGSSPRSNPPLIPIREASSFPFRKPQSIVESPCRFLQTFPLSANRDLRPVSFCFHGVALTSRPADRRKQITQIIEGSEKHQHYDDCKADPESDLLSLLRKRPPSHRFDGIEQKVTTIEKRNREQVEQPDRDGQDRDQPQPRLQADSRNLA